MRQTFNEHKAIVFALIFFCIAATYSLAIPIFEASDETLHYPYVKQLADGNGLPIAGQDILLKQEATQAPLYYLLAAAATFWIDSDDLMDLLNFNPHWLDTSPRIAINDNQNMIAHSPAERFPFAGAARAIHVARLLSVLFGAVAVFFAIRIADEIFPDTPWLTTGVGAMVAFNPQFVRTSATVSNDAASTAMVAVVVFLALRWSRPLSSWRQSVVLGLVSGLAILSKLNGIIVLAMVGIIVLMRFAQNRHGENGVARKQWQSLITTGLIIVGVAGVVSGWFFVRNWMLYGELTATNIHLNLAGRGHLSLSQIVALLPEIERTFWASFGWGQIRVADWIYELIRWGRNFAWIGFAFVIFQNLRRRQWKTLAYIAMLTGWVAIIVALFVQWISLVGSVSHARLMFPALPAIAILSVLGLGAWFPVRWRQSVMSMIAVVLFVFAASSLWVYVLPAYTPDFIREGNSAPPTLSTLNYNYDNTIRLTAAEISPTEAHPGDTVNLILYWQALAHPRINYSVFARVIEADEHVIVGRNTYPGLGLLPTRYWLAGQNIQDVLPMRIPNKVGNLPLVADVRVGLFDFKRADHSAFPAISSNGDIVLPSVAKVKITPRKWQSISPQHPLSVDFADNISLAGYNWECASTCQLTLYWVPTGKPNFPYTIFIQYWKNGEQQSGFDAPPRGGQYPTNWWDDGELIVDAHELPQLMDGELRIGLYRLDTGERLPILENGTHIENHALIIPVTP